MPIAEVISLADRRPQAPEAPPPHDLGAELALLGACVLWQDQTHPLLVRRQVTALASALEINRPEHFFDFANGRVFQALQQLTAARTPIDRTTLRRWLEDRNWWQKIGGEDHFKRLENAPFIATNARAHALIIERKWRAREALATMQRLCLGLRHGQAEGEENDFLNSLPDVVARAARGGPASTCVTLRDAFAQSFAVIERASSGMAGYPTGIRALDGLTGGMHPREVVLVKAPKKSGKSVLVGQVACTIADTPRRIGPRCEACSGERDVHHMWRWRGSIVFALEGQVSDWSTRIACSSAKLDYDALLKGQWGQHHLAKFTTAAEELQHLPVRIEADKKLTLSKIEARVRAVREEMLDSACLNCGGRGRVRPEGHATDLECLACNGSGRGVDLAFAAIDYVQLMRDLSGNSRGNREQFLSGVVSDLMDLVSTPDLSAVSWMVVSQMNQNGVARESEAIEMHVDRVWRLSVSNDRKGYDGLEARINVEAARRGPQGPDVNAAFFFEPSNTVFYG